MVCVSVAGKGANPCVMAARLGARVHLIGKVKDPTSVLWLGARVHRIGKVKVPTCVYWLGARIHLIGKVKEPTCVFNNWEPGSTT